MAKVYLSPSNQTDNKYAYGNTTEAVQCGIIAEACKAALERNGVSVMLGHYKTMAVRCNESDKFGADLHIPIHTNAANKSVSGTRIFCYDKSGKGYEAAQAVYNVLAPLTPGKSENISVNKTYYEILHPNAPTVYIECEFHDVASIAKWIIENTTAIGEAIAHGICNYFGITFKASGSSKPAATTPATNPAAATKSVSEVAKEVIAGKWGNGDARKTALTKAGYSYDAVQAEVNKLLGGGSSTASYKVKVTSPALNIRAGAGTKYAVTGCIRDKGVYTILETSGNWGKLKSGAGWICLDYTKKV